MTVTNDPRHAPSRRVYKRRRRLLVFSGLITFIVTASVGWWYWGQPRLKFDEVERALQQRRLGDAESLARVWLKSYPRDVNALVVLGEALQRQGKTADAVEVYQQIPFDAGKKGTSAQLALVSILLHQGRLSDAEKILLQLKPSSSQAQVADGLWVTLMSLSGRRWESMPYLQRALSAPVDPFMKLIYLANPDEMPAPPDDVFARMYQVRDPLGALGCGRVAASLGRVEQATTLVRECLAERPELIEAHVLEGSILLDSGDLKQFDRWETNLPAAADVHPSTWFLRGRRTQDAGQNRAAIRCYWETLRRQPNHDRATYQLGQLLQAEGRDEAALPFLQRAKQLTRLIELAVRMFKDRGSIEENVECAELTYKLGRLHESQVWCEITLAKAPGNTAARELLQKLSLELGLNTPWLLPQADVASHIDLSNYPLPDRGGLANEAIETPNSTLLESAQIGWVDEAVSLGLQFRYFNGDDASSEGKRMFEYTGGGVAALDYDLDGWCDLYFTQGTTWPPVRSNQEFLDSLFRNEAGQRMQEVGGLAGIRDVGFGQGVSSADFDNDGFPDLYVANIDGNRLYKNQGDGTFRDITDSSGLGQHVHWTTTCLMVDLDGDALPDVYDVTYLTGEEIYSRVCQGDDGIAASCPPALFPAAVDHVYRNRGDGTFVEMTQEWGFDAPQGDGLGIVAGDFDDSGMISLFVGNDGRANFFFVPERQPDGKLRWHETGLVSGLAYDDSGAAQACMGIAAGDANNDGRVDLFVTNFYNESNTLYVNLGGRTFTDRARSTGLRDPSWSLLGFGTQFVDADRDGWEDLILVNGHVDDFTHKQIPYKMRPQFFQNQSPRFTERFGKDIGPFFDEPRLGRGLARLDWNRDGLNDAAVSQIGDPAALLTNRTRRPGRGIGLRLVGTNGSRDAIGTRVTVKAGSQEWTRQLTAGDGYQATNQRRLDFGLGQNKDDLQIEIYWIGGTSQTFHLDPTKTELIAIEGRPALLQNSPEID